ncbi:DMT family transporter [Starkeya sp. ORNL1]|nr:DMT family transporter [Starkeya sp. ORNL1]
MQHESAMTPGVSRETLGMWLGLLGVVLFGGTLPATRLAVVGLDPLFITVGRAAVAGVLSAGILLLLRRRLPIPSQLRTMALAGSMITIGFPWLMALSLQTVPASHGGVVLGILPLTTAAAASLILGERPSLRFWLFAVLGTAVVIVFALRDGGGHVAIGDLYMFAAAICASVGYVYSGRLARDMPGWEVICWILVLALPVMLPLALWTMPADVSAVPASAWAGFGYVALFSMFLGFFAWNAGMAMGGVARVSQVQLLQTFVTLALSALVNGEHIDPVTIVAALAVVGIVAIGRKARIQPR